MKTFPSAHQNEFASRDSLPILISFALTSFGAVRKGVHSLDEVLKCFIYTFRQTQTAQQYSKHVFIESEEKEGKKNSKMHRTV